MSGRKEEELGKNGQTISEFGAIMRAWRRSRGLSVTELAVRADFGNSGRSYISKIEHGVIRHVADDRLERIATALGASRMDLLLKQLPPGYTLEAVGAKEAVSLPPAPIDEWAVIDRIRRGMAEGLAAGHRPSPVPDAEGMLNLNSGFTADSGGHSISRSGDETFSLLDLHTQRRVNAAIDRIEASSIALLRQIIESEIRPALIRLVIAEIAATRSNDPISSALGSSPQVNDIRNTIAEEVDNVPAQAALFAGALSQILQRHGRQLSNLYEVRVGQGRIHPQKIQRLKRAAAGDYSRSVTLNPDEIAAIERTFALDDDDRHQLRAALVAESVFRYLSDRTSTEEALHIGRALLRNLFDSQAQHGIKDSSDEVARQVLSTEQALNGR